MDRTEEEQKKGEEGEEILPFRQAGQIVSPRPLLNEGRDTKPRSVSVIPGSVAARNAVLDHLSPGACGLDLGCRGQVADENDLGNVAARRGAECAGRTQEARSGGGEATS